MNLSYLSVNHISSFVLRVQSDAVLFRETTAVIGCLLFLILLSQNNNHFRLNAFCYFVYMETSYNQNWIREYV